MRDKIDERRHFYSHEKKYIAKKSKGRCAHCGCMLKKPSDMTIEHIIPITKGGTNDESNLAVLCEACNKKKGEKVLLPSSYLKYFTNKHSALVDKMFDAYCKEVGYLTSKNFLFSDSVAVDINIKLWSNSRTYSNLKSYLCKALYCDLDEILAFCCEYYYHFNIDVDVYKLVRTYFDRGAIYYTRNMSGVIDYVLFAGVFSDIEHEKIAYGVSIAVLAKPGLSLTRKAKVVRGGLAMDMFSSDMSCLKFDAILKTFLRGCLKSSEDNNIGRCADVNIYWYGVDTRVSKFFNETSAKGYRTGTGLEGMEDIRFSSSQEEGSYDWEKSKDWNLYIESIYSVDDEIELYTALREKKYMLDIMFKAKRLREYRESIYGVEETI